MSTDARALRMAAAIPASGMTRTRRSCSARCRAADTAGETLPPAPGAPATASTSRSPSDWPRTERIVGSTPSEVGASAATPASRGAEAVRDTASATPSRPLPVSGTSPSSGMTTVSTGRCRRPRALPGRLMDVPAAPCAPARPTPSGTIPEPDPVRQSQADRRGPGHAH